MAFLFPSLMRVSQVVRGAQLADGTATRNYFTSAMATPQSM
ncbi:MAG TPA: hypothetical protein VF458_19170 [Ktedonobacteraceae bacterium]